MAETDKLKSMLDNLIKDRGEQAQVDFHDYLQDKMQDVIRPTDVDEPAEPVTKTKSD